MSVSSKDIRKNINLTNDTPEEKYHRRPKKQISLQNDFYKQEIYKKLNEGCILKYIRSNERKESVKTNFSDSDKELKYDLCMINKFDENLNTSLSFISEFDLEDDEKENNSFNSSENESCIEEIEIKKNKKILVENEEFYFELDKEWEDIREHLLNKENN